MTRLRAALHILRGPSARIRHAEQRFFDAYGRGGALQDRRLVVPLDFFSRPTVQRALYNWLREGQVLDLDALEAEWDSTHRELDKDAFRENITQFLALLANPDACRVTWTLPDGTPFDYGSEVLR